MTDIESSMRSIYEKTRRIREDNRLQLGRLYPLGFKIIHAPPLPKPPILFIGIQPGGDKADEASGETFAWPKRLDYEIGEWALAR